MTNNLITKSITINASTAVVWQVITTPALIRRWMSEEGTDVISDWQIGSNIDFIGKLHGRPYHDRGTVLRFEPDTVLRYNYWSRISGLSDRPENRSIIEFRLTPVGEVTGLSLECSTAKAAVEHWNFYWNVALYLIKQVAEGLPA